MYLVTIALQPQEFENFVPWLLIVQTTHSYQEAMSTSAVLKEELLHETIKYETLHDTNIGCANLVYVTDAAVDRFNTSDKPSLSLTSFVDEEDDCLKSYGSFVFEIEDDEADTFLKQSLLSLLGWRGDTQIQPVLVHSARPTHPLLL
uniref:Uncharacterized protein n=1 Tax=viral metagenome TaxID=1070528 RepID=A0A2V0RBA3_9ZZZZ